MKDIEINTPLRKFHYWLSWIGFIVTGGAWVIAIILANVGKTTSANVPSKKNLLNKTWQKFVYVYGLVVAYFTIASLVVVALVGG